MASDGTHALSVVEFQSVLKALNAYDDRFFLRQSGYAFRMGMMTQVEECTSLRFQEMNFVEFLHSLGAVVFLKQSDPIESIALQLDAFFGEHLLAAASGRTKD